ncbi:MAG TPA: hypothetical protein VFQ30_16495 [Ktedonobacteraceae bacterium]|nr:hypothetical protein [Ktedonobacteraceae bacterium]
MTQEQSRRRRSRADRNRPVLVTSGTAIENEGSELNTEDGQIDEINEMAMAEEPMPVAPAKPARRLPGFFSTIGKKTETEAEPEVDVAQARLARATRKVGAVSATKETTTSKKESDGEQETKKPAPARAAAPARPGGFKTRYLLGMVVYLLGANFIGIFEASFMSSNHLNIVLTTFNLFGGNIVISTSTLVFLLTLILLLIVLAKFDLIPRSFSAMSGASTPQRGQSSSRNNNSAEATPKTPPPVMKQGVKGEDDDLYDEYRANQRYMQRRARKR